MYNVDNNKPYVATYKEIFIGFITFALILIVLYPKDMLERQVLSESSNYDLSILYLKNMLKNDDGNEELMFNLAKQSLRGDKRDLAYRLLSLLKSSKDSHMQSQAYLLSYQIAKEDYYYLIEDNSKEKAKQLFKDLRQLNKYIVFKHFYPKEKINQRYEESLFLKDKETAYYLVQKILKSDTSDITQLSNAYYLAVSLQHYNDALMYLDTLILIDNARQDSHKEAKYFLLFKYFSPKHAEIYLKQEAQDSPIWMEKLAYFYLGQKDYKKSSHLYMTLFKQTDKYEKQNYYWKKAIQTLQSGNYLQQASNLGLKYQNKFLKSDDTGLFLLKLYLQANNLQRGNRLAKEMLQRRRKK